jgi:hypothetical protein
MLLLRLREVGQASSTTDGFVDHNPSLRPEYFLESESSEESAERLAGCPAEQRGMGANLGTRQSRSKSKDSLTAFPAARMLDTAS